jgi:outer membrane protein assembly factor BamB
MQRAPCTAISVVALFLSLALALPPARGTELTIRHASSGAVTLVRNQGAQLVAQDARGALLWTYAPPQLQGSCQGAVQFTLWQDDRNRDGQITASTGERALLFATLSWQSGSALHSQLFALDVGTPGTRQLLWQLDESSLPALGQLVSAPTAARIRIGRANRDPQQGVVLLGAGVPVPGKTSRNGAALLAVDASSGTLLWSASAAQGASQRYAAADAAFAGAITALDLDADGYTDRLYLGDWAARIWRFDISPGNAAATLTRGGVIADLADPAQPVALGFIAAPDVTLFTDAAAMRWFNIAVGSVATGNGTADNALFVLRERDPYARLTQAQFDGLPVLTQADLPEQAALTDSATARGYRVSLGSAQSAGRALTVNGTLLYTQFTGTAPWLALCLATPNVIVTATAIDAVTGSASREVPVTTAANASDSRIALPTGTQAQTDIEGSPPATPDSALRCTAAGVTLPACASAPRWRRVYWRREDAD